jgi:hypothetical protein
MYEHKSQQLLPRNRYLWRLIGHASAAFSVMLCSLAVGILGYHFLGGLSWIDSLLNASMILGGMGPINELHTTAVKIFASFYALFSGIVFLVIAGILIAPFIHRLLHQLHLEEGDNPPTDGGSQR